MVKLPRSPLVQLALHVFLLIFNLHVFEIYANFQEYNTHAKLEVFVQWKGGGEEQVPLCPACGLVSWVYLTAFGVLNKVDLMI